jgi:hypothetical protein
MHLFIPRHFSDSTKSPPKMTREVCRWWQVANGPLLHAFLGDPKQFGDLFGADKHVIVELGQTLKQLVVPVQSCSSGVPMTSLHVLDSLAHEALSGVQITSAPIRKAYGLHLACLILADTIKNNDERALSRAREVMPLVQGTLLIQAMIRNVCRAAGASTNPACKVWFGGKEEIDRFTQWDKTCKICRDPSVPRRVFCSAAFPTSLNLQGLRSRSRQQPSLVKDNQLKHWTSGRRPLPFGLARMMLRSLFRHGYITLKEYDIKLYMVEQMTAFLWRFRALRRELARNWAEMRSDRLGLAATWIGKQTDYSLFEIEGDVEGCMNEEQFPFVPGFRKFNILFNLPLAEPQDLQGRRVQAEVRVTPYPLAIDEALGKRRPTQEEFSIRIFIYPACAA